MRLEPGGGQEASIEPWPRAFDFLGFWGGFRNFGGPLGWKVQGFWDLGCRSFFRVRGCVGFRVWELGVRGV